LPEAFRRGLASANLSGRAQIVKDISLENSSVRGNLVFYLDGAHTPESLDACARWFSIATIRANSSNLNGIVDVLHGNAHGYEYSNGNSYDYSNGNSNPPWRNSKRVSENLMLFYTIFGEQV
jgi:hypothetical protein